MRVSIRKAFSKSLVLPICIGTLLHSSLSSATEYTKETTLTSVGVQGNRPVQTSTQNSLWINFSEGTVWSVNGGSGGAACPEGAAILPDDNAMMRAVALTAIASGSEGSSRRG
jgi:hypothetical protein